MALAAEARLEGSFCQGHRPTGSAQQPARVLQPLPHQEAVRRLADRPVESLRKVARADSNYRCQVGQRQLLAQVRLDVRPHSCLGVGGEEDRRTCQGGGWALLQVAFAHMNAGQVCQGLDVARSKPLLAPQPGRGFCDEVEEKRTYVAATS